MEGYGEWKEDMDIEAWWMRHMLERFKGLDLLHRKWVTLDEHWDHDHCVFCMEKLDASTEALAYCTEDYYHWICEQCYSDHKEAFGWALVEEDEESAGETCQFSFDGQ